MASTVLSLLLLSSPALAVVALQGAAGPKSADVAAGDESSSLGGYELKAQLHFDPIPLLPVALGWSMGWSRLTGHEATREIVGYEIALEAVGWYTFAIQDANLSPYVKVGRTTWGSYRVKRDDGSGKYEPRGGRFAVGLRWDMLFKLGLLLEVEKTSVVLSGDDPSVAVETTSILFGWQTGL